ncbi:hypothetical protein Trydic_g23403 [Trypoxylus dichotomus]
MYRRLPYIFSASCLQRQNASTYEPIITDPTTYLEKTTRTKINNAPLTEETKKSIIPREKSSKCPEKYGLPKIYKQDIPLMPIMSTFVTNGLKIPHISYFATP